VEATVDTRSDGGLDYTSLRGAKMKRRRYVVAIIKAREKPNSITHHFSLGMDVVTAESRIEALGKTAHKIFCDGQQRDYKVADMGILEI